MAEDQQEQQDDAADAEGRTDGGDDVAEAGGAVGGRQAALGLLRDQIRSCVPSSFSIRRA